MGKIGEVGNFKIGEVGNFTLPSSVGVMVNR